jgi:hypothetical protein
MAAWKRGLLLRLLQFNIQAAAAAAAAAAGQKSGWVWAMKPDYCSVNCCWSAEFNIQAAAAAPAAAAAAGKKFGWVWALKSEHGSVDCCYVCCVSISKLLLLLVLLQAKNQVGCGR